MTERHDPHDTQLDRNLDTIGRRVALPAEASVRQRAAWKRSPARPESTTAVAAPRIAHGLCRGNLGRNWAMAGSAIAAAVLWCAFLLNPVQPNRVEAAMILRSFREAAHQGFRVTIENIDVEGIRAEGEILMQFAEPVNFAGLLGEGGPIAEPEWVTLDLNVTTTADCNRLPGLTLRIAGAAQGATEWFFIKAERLPNELLEELPAPVAWWLQSLLGNGVMFDLTGLDESQVLGGLDVDSADGAAISSSLHSEVRFSVGSTPEAVDAPNGIAFKFDTRISADGAADVDTPPSDDDSPPSDEIAAEAALLSLFTGQARREQLDELFALLTQSSADAQVQEVEPGLYRLTATGFGGDDGAAHSLIQNAVLRITYRENAGVESLALEHIGAADGSVRLEFCDEVTLDPQQLDRNRLIEPGVTTVIDAQTIGAFAGMFSGI